jgi:hypothetical protein
MVFMVLSKMQDVINVLLPAYLIYQKGQENGVFLLVKGNRVADGRRVFFGAASGLFQLLFVVIVHH